MMLSEATGTGRDLDAQKQGRLTLRDVRRAEDILGKQLEV